MVSSLGGEKTPQYTVVSKNTKNSEASRFQLSPSELKCANFWKRSRPGEHVD